MDINNLLGEPFVTVITPFTARLIQSVVNHDINRINSIVAKLDKGHRLLIKKIGVRIKFYDDYLNDKNNVTFCELILHCDSETDGSVYLIRVDSETSLHCLKGHERFVLYAQNFKKNKDSVELRQSLDDTRIPIAFFTMS